MSDVREFVAPSDLPPRVAQLVLVLILMIALGVRLFRLTDAPPGWNQDEAANAWNAWCLLKTGTDQHGQAWPVFYFRALGENRSTLYLYLVIPFQWLFGLNTFSVRLPNLVGGMGLVALGYYIASRIFDRKVGLLTAALLALQPWAIYMSRWGNEGGLTGFLSCLPVGTLLWSRLLPTARSVPAESRPVCAGIGGLICGLACYGYFAARLFIPVMLAVLVFGHARHVLGLLRDKQARLAVVLFGVAFAAIFAPLALMHLRYPEIMNVRGKSLWVISPEDSLQRAVSVVGERYLQHFNPEFLFHIGDEYEEVWPSGRGVLPWATAPLMVLGLFWIFTRREWKSAKTVVLLWVLVYPAGDILTAHFTAHAMRGAPGMFIAALLAALGAAGSWRAISKTPLRVSRLALGTIATVFVVIQSAGFLWFLLHDRARDERARSIFHSDLSEVCAWLRPRLDQFSAVYITPTDFNLPYIVTLCALQVNPREWLSGPRESFGERRWDVYSRFGKVHFLYDRVAASQKVVGNEHKLNRPALLIVRPGESERQGPVKVICDAYGREELRVYVLSE